MKIEDKTILVIDDSELHRILLEDLLQKMGVNHIISASNGLEGIRNARYYKPDLVLLDLRMPKIDGFETCEKIRLFANEISMPIIVLTADEQPGSLERILSLGANDYFPKPFNEIEIKNRIIFYLDYCETLQRLSKLKKIVNRDLHMAESIQRYTIPCPQTSRKQLLEHTLDFYAYTSEELLGGDSWGYFTLGCGAVVLTICDVTGHGINAAINNSFITSVIANTFEKYAHLTSNQFSPTDFAQEVNTVIYNHMQTGMYCTGACLLVKPDEIIYAAAALPEIRALNMRTGQMHEYSCNGLPLGISPKMNHITEGRIPFDENTFILVTTDGITESQKKDEPNAYLKTNTQLPGEKFLNDYLNFMHNDCKTLNTQKFLLNLITAYEQKGFDLTHDDVTLFAFKKLPRGAQ